MPTCIMKFLNMYSCLLIACCLVIVASAAAQHLQWKNRLIDASRDEGEEGDENHKIKFPSLAELDEEWQSFKSNYEKTYDDASEEMIRKSIFAKHLKELIVNNYLYTKGLKSFTMGINEFSDLEHSEFVKMMTCGESFNLTETTGGSTFLAPEVNFTLPNEVDWRSKGYVTRVKHQGKCGSCWAFSATGSLEGQHFRKTRKLVSLSEQQLVDCSRAYGNDGCGGGWTFKAFNYIKANNGLDTERSYPYEGKASSCRYRRAYRGATCNGYVSIKKYSESELMSVVASVGPVSVSIDASQPSFQKPKKGVYNEPLCSSTKLGHAVLVVGYGTSRNDGDYWIVKNSWGTTWGMDGYILMSRNKNNQCGIATRATYPLV